MTEKDKQTKITDLISENTDKESLKILIERLLTDQEKEDLGDNPVNQFIERISWLVPFASAPATFDNEAFMAVTDLSQSEATITQNICVRIGFLNQDGGRFSLPVIIKNMLKNKSNGYLT